jgi:hypothetical protein
MPAGDVGNGDRGPNRKRLSFPRTNPKVFLPSRPVQEGQKKKAPQRIRDHQSSNRTTTVLKSTTEFIVSMRITLALTSDAVLARNLPEGNT